jgi:hypothetical protein
MTDIPQLDSIASALKRFQPSEQAGDLGLTAKAFFDVLGYGSERRLPIHSVQDLKSQLDVNNYLTNETALIDQWQSVHWLFQLTSAEVLHRSQGKLDLGLQTAYEKKDIFSYLFFAIDLKGSASKAQLVQMTRALNRIVLMPILVLFRHAGKVSIAVVNRRRNLRDDTKQVLTAVSLIRDIRCDAPHRAHMHLLQRFSLAALEQNARESKTTINSFAALDTAWQKILSTESLNQAFYNDLSTWFAWARQEVRLNQWPPGALTAATKQKATDEFLVRTVCRLMFAWFLKEKGLIPTELLELHDMLDKPVNLTAGLLTVTASDPFFEGNHYYRGILQNIFFKALNTPREQRMGSASAVGKRFLGTGYLPADFDYERFIQIPYLNGGLFEQQIEDNYNDSIEDAVIYIPNKLFYAKRDDGYTTTRPEGKKGQTFKVEGLNRIFSHYIFTVSENTSLDEDVALDPELLGLVFENLLAEIDPNIEESVQKSIRKQSGSYYTPKRVVQYMVNESLYLYLKTKFLALTGSLSEQQTRQSLLTALCFGTHQTPPTPRETLRYQPIARHVVDALESLRVLDPACGSGAFPMGMLHRMVELLEIVDPHNDLWKRKLLTGVPLVLRSKMEDHLRGKTYNYERKLHIIRSTLFGVDIQPLAALISKLRFFLSLIIEQTPSTDAASNYGLTPLPNLETNLLCANTLHDVQIDLLSGAGLADYLAAREQYFETGISSTQRDTIANQIGAQLANWFPRFSEDALGLPRIADAATAHQQNTEQLKRWFRTAAIPAPFFSADAFYPEAMQDKPSTANAMGVAKGFHIVIGNPPYGGTPIEESVKRGLGLASKDPYGAFLARFLNSGAGCPQSPIAAGGVLAMIVSDTFMTIKSHKPLREHLLAHRVHKLLRVHKDTFNATVNTAIVIAQQGAADTDHYLQAADFTNVSIHHDYARFSHLLRQTEGASFAHRLNVSNPQYAIYHYPQALIRTNNNLPLFVASPKLFGLMNDNAPKPTQEIAGKTVPVRQISMNGQTVQLVKLGDIAQVKVGLQTGDNDSYLFQEPTARGNYRSIEAVHHLVLTEADLARIQGDQELRTDVIDNGIAKDDKKSPRYFGGRYIAPYDKGGESDSESGWLPNYWVATDYYIDWSEASITRLKTLTTKDRNKLDGKSGGDDRLCSRFQNSGSYYQTSLTSSRVGEYSPSFRYGSDTVFDSGCSNLFFDVDRDDLLAKLCSKVYLLLFKNLLNHTVNSQTDDHLDIVVPAIEQSALKALVLKILQKQRATPRYDYASNEQLEIDALIYAAYGLNDDDVREVEFWYERRYQKLAKAQRAALVAAGRAPQIKQAVVHWFGDESRHLPFDRSPVMLLGGIACPQALVAQSHRELAALWAAHGMPSHFETKWTKVSPAKLPFYEALMDWFFAQPHLSFRALVVPNKDELFAKLPKVTQDLAYYRLYYYLLHGAIEPQTRLRVFIDIKDTRGREKVKELQSSLKDDAGDAAMVGEVQQVHSHEVRLLQITDLLLGAIGYARVAALQPTQIASPAKRALIARMEQHLGQSLLLDTPPGSPRMTVLSWLDMDALTA